MLTSITSRKYTRSTDTSSFLTILRNRLEKGRVDIIPPQPDDIKIPPVREPDPIEADPISSDKPTHITWTSSVISYDPVTKRTRIRLVATNPSEVTVAFDRVTVFPLSIKSLGSIALYNDLPGEWEEKKAPPHDENDNSRGEGKKEQLDKPDNDKSDGKEDNKEDNKEDGPKNTWSLHQNGIKEMLEMDLSDSDGLPVFAIWVPSKKVKGRTKRQRFYMPPGSSFTLELDGETEKPGDYLIQMNELWNSPDAHENWLGREWADTFYKFILQPEGGGASTRVGKAESEKIRGVGS